MYPIQTNLLRKLGILTVMILLALAVSSCGDDDPVTPPTTGNRAPGIPSNDTAAGSPADGATDVSTAPTLHWICTDPDGDALTFTVRLGTAAVPPEVSTGQGATSLGPFSLEYETTYYWQIVAEDPDGETATSPVWDFTTAAENVETVSQPAAPTGPATGLVGEDLEFTASGATSSFGSAVEYRFDWGGGNLSDWSAATAVTHAWAAAGSYDVKAQARSATNNAIESVWSVATAVEITVPLETITMSTNSISGPDNLEAGVAGDFTISGFVTSSEGHDTEFRFVWGDGSFGDWTTVKAGSHAYDTPGEYILGVEGRCILHPSVTASRTDLHTVTIAAGETITAPGQVSGISSNNISSTEYWVSSNATSSFGHALELQYDFGDGVISDWVAEYTPTPHTWALGTYDVVARARCVEHPTVVSEWGAVRTAAFNELLTGLSVPTGPATGVTGDPIAFSTAEALSNEGHAVEYQYYYRKASTTDYFYSEWFPTTEGTLTWDAAGTYYVYVKARCIEHPDVTRSAGSDHLTIVISPAP